MYTIKKPLCVTVNSWLFFVCLFAGANAAVSASSSAGCPASPASKPAALSGLWQVESYREINGNKAYLQPGDYALIEPTGVPGEACLEFSSFVEGNYYYYVAIDESGSTIDDNVTTGSGANLRVLVQRVGEGVSIVLYASAGTAFVEGGSEGPGGGVAGGGRP